MQRLSLLKEHWWGSGKCTGGHLLSFLRPNDMQDTPGRSFPLTPLCFGGSRRQGLKEWTGKLRNLLEGSNRTPSKGQPVGMLPWVPVGESVRPGLRKDAWLSFKGKGRHLKSWKVRIPVFDRCIEYTHTQSTRGSCAHPPRGLHHFSEHREYKTSFQKKNNNNNNNKAEVQNPDFWVVCV